MEEEDIEFQTIIVEERVKQLWENDAQSPSSRKAVKRIRSAARKQLQSAVCYLREGCEGGQCARTVSVYF